MFYLQGYFLRRASSLICRANSNYLRTLRARFLFSSPAAETTVLFFSAAILLYDPVYEAIKICPQKYFRTPSSPTHSHCLPSSEPRRAFTRSPPPIALCRQKAKHTHLKPYFKKHQFLKYPGEPAERAGAQQSRNVSYFSKPTYATSKRRERSHLRFVTWSPP